MGRFFKQDGSAIIEMAIILPIIVLLMVGALEIGLLIDRKATCQGAAAEGARKAAVNGSWSRTTVEGGSSANKRVKYIMESNGMIPYKAEVHIGKSVSVDVRYTQKVITPLFRQLVGSGKVTVDGEAIGKNEFD